MLENILLSEGGKFQSKVIIEPQISQINADYFNNIVQFALICEIYGSTIKMY